MFVKIYEKEMAIRSPATYVAIVVTDNKPSAGNFPEAHIDIGVHGHPLPPLKKMDFDVDCVSYSAGWFLQSDGTIEQYPPAVGLSRNTKPLTRVGFFANVLFSLIPLFLKRRSHPWP
jgi:hypothetical protein